MLIRLLLAFVLMLISLKSPAQEMFFHLLGLNSFPNFTWTGQGADANWTTTANWSGNAVPGSSDKANFILEACTSNCSPQINASISVGGINIQSGFTGTLTQAAGVSITIGSLGWTQAGGSFVGSASSITFNGAFSLSGGTFTSTSGTLQTGYNFSISGSPTFNANAGTLSFVTDGSVSIAPGSANFNNVSFGGCYGAYDFGGASMNINGTLTMNGGGCNSRRLNSGTLLVKGDVNATNYGYVGTALVKLVGSTNQTITGGTNAYIPNLEIASTGGTVSFSGTLVLQGNYTYTSGTVNPGTSTLSWGTDSAVSIVPGPIVYNNISLSGCLGSYDLGGATIAVGGTLTLAGGCSPSLTNGTWEARGDVNITNNGYGGSALIRIAGSSNQTVTGVSTGRLPNLEIASSGGTVTLSGTLLLLGNYTYTSGVVDSGTSTLSWNTDATVTIIPGPVQYYNVSFGGCNGTYGLGGNTMTLGGSLTLASGCGGNVNNGTLAVKGDVTASNNGEGGSVLVKLTGSTNQTVSGITNARIPNLEVASTGGTVNLSGTLSLTANFTFTSGTLNAGTSTLRWNTDASVTIVPGSASYNNVTFIGCVGSFNLSSQTMTVNGTLTIGSGCSGSINSGTFLANGDVVFNNNGFYGNASLTFSGATSSNLTVGGSAQRMTGSLTVNKTGGAALTLLSSASFNGSSQDLTISSGTLNMAGYNLTIGRNITNSGTLQRGTSPSCGTLSYAGTYSGTAAVCP